MLKPEWRYRVFSVVGKVGGAFGYASLPYRTLLVRLWYWCHYKHGRGAHLNLRWIGWRAAWKGELCRYEEDE